MKKRILIISILTLLLTSCGDKYEHTVEPTGGVILLYIFILCFIIPFFALSISFLIRGIRRLIRKPPIATGKKFTIMGGIFGGVGLTLLIVLNVLYFPNPISVPNANKYNSPEKAMKAATDEDKCEFSVAQEYSPNYYKDQDFLLRDAIKGIKDYKSTSNFRKVKQDCDSFHYYVVLNKTNQYDVFPFVQVSIFANGNFFIDYVRSKNNGTVSYYYKMNQVDAENLVTYAYQVRSKYVKDNHKEEDEYNAKAYEDGKIENFFKKAATMDNITYALAKNKNVIDPICYYGENFKKELFEIIADFNYYSESENLQIGAESNYKELFVYNYHNSNSDYSMPWKFTVYITELNRYYVRLVYRYPSLSGRNSCEIEYCYSMTSSQGDGLYDVLLNNQSGGNM